MVDVINNVVPEFYRNEIITAMTDISFPWFYSEETVYKNPNTSKEMNIDSNTVESQMFSHVFFLPQSGYSATYKVIQPLMYYIQEKTGYQVTNPHKLNRIKANLMLRERDYPNDSYNTQHVDLLDDRFTTIVYYINDSDGDTVLFDNGNVSHRQTPEANSILIFKSNQFHASTPPKVASKRMVLNVVVRNE